MKLERQDQNFLLALEESANRLSQGDMDFLCRDQLAAMIMVDPTSNFVYNDLNQFIALVYNYLFDIDPKTHRKTLKHFMYPTFLVLRAHSACSNSPQLTLRILMNMAFQSTFPIYCAERV